MNEILQSQAATAVLTLLTIYFLVKALAVAGKMWAPQHRKLTLDEAQMKEWRRLVCLSSVGLAALWAGLLLSAHVHTWGGIAVGIVGVVLYGVTAVLLRKKYPYIDPATVKKSGKKKKK